MFPWSNHHIWADDKQDFGNTRISVEPWQCLYVLNDDSHLSKLLAFTNPETHNLTRYMFFFLSCLPARISISRMTYMIR